MLSDKMLFLKPSYSRTHGKEKKTIIFAENHEYIETDIIKFCTVVSEVSSPPPPLLFLQLQ